MIRNFLKEEYNRNIVLNYIFKSTSIILGLIVTRITLGYLGATLYGLWVTITSVISWMNSGDLGIGNGLRNALAKAYGEKDQERQKLLISEAVNCLTKVAVVLLIIIVILCEFFLKIGILDGIVRIPMYITAIFFCINLVLGISQSIAFSYQKSWLNAATVCEFQVFSITFICFLQSMNVKASLTLFAFVYGICTTIPNFILIYILKKNIIQFQVSRWRVSSKEIQKTIMSTGIQFFIIQLSGVVLYSTDSLLINWLISSEMVTKYSIITKVYDTGTNLFSILLIALWSAVTYHIAQQDYSWVRDQIMKLLKCWCVFALGAVIVSIGFNCIVRIWLGNDAMYFESPLVIVFCAYCIMTAFSAIFVNVLNGMGIVKLQLGLAVIAAIINIPLSIFFVQNYDMGIFGIKLATLLCASIPAVVMPIQVISLLKKGCTLGIS